MNMYILIYFYLFSVIYIFTDVDIYLFFCTLLSPAPCVMFVIWRLFYCTSGGQSVRCRVEIEVPSSRSYLFRNRKEK